MAFTFTPLTTEELSDAVSFRNIDKHGPMTTWDVSNITDFSSLFSRFTFENDEEDTISNWDVSNATDMSMMFAGCNEFNQPLNNWDVSKVTNMYFMFGDCSAFNQPLTKWNISKNCNITNMFLGCSIDDNNKPYIIIQVRKSSGRSLMPGGGKTFRKRKRKIYTKKRSIKKRSATKIKNKK